jgi:tRNA-2-methylthio-N6-dimethylallyladenosine synthase
VAIQQVAHLDALVGTTQTVLVEGPSRGDAPNRFMGRSGRHEIVHLDVPAGADPTGQLVEVHIERAYKHSLAGTMTTPVTDAMRARRVPSRRLRVLDDAAVSG